MNQSKKVVLVAGALNLNSQKVKNDIDDSREKLKEMLLSVDMLLSGKNNNSNTNSGIEVKSIIVSPEIRSNALENNISIGRCCILVEAEKKSIYIPIEKAKDISVDEALEKVDIVNFLETDTQIDDRRVTSVSTRKVDGVIEPTPISINEINSYANIQIEPEDFAKLHTISPTVDEVPIATMALKLATTPIVNLTVVPTPTVIKPTSSLTPVLTHTPTATIEHTPTYSPLLLCLLILLLPLLCLLRLQLLLLRLLLLLHHLIS